MNQQKCRYSKDYENTKGMTKVPFIKGGTKRKIHKKTYIKKRYIKKNFFCYAARHY